MRPASLPIWQVHPGIVAALGQARRLVLVAPTGSGKSTQVPQMLLDAGLAGGKKVVVLQPRRVAARTLAARVAWERGGPIGAEVGYQVRFDDHTTLGTRLSYVTEGILLRRLQEDPLLADTGAVLFDEFHERNLMSDVALGLVKRLQDTERPELKLAVMSATLEAEPVARYLAASPNGTPAPLLRSEGQAFPVETRYLDQPDDRPVTEQAADAVEGIVNAGDPGDILVFMPGMGEINATIAALRAIHVHERLALIPLHGELPPDQQDLAFAPNALRKVVVATNVAETSVTIEGVRHVVDGGLARVARYDAERGLGTLFIEPISRASADQRKGRAGRTGPGVCHRLWTESGHLNRPDRNTPEIQRSDLAEVVLLLHSLGIGHAAGFDWLDHPDPQAVERAEQLLRTLGALRAVPTAATPLLPGPGQIAAAAEVGPPSGGRTPGQTAGSDLTQIGRQMLKLPLHPRYSRMLVEARRLGCVPAAALCAAQVSGRDLLMRLGRADQHIKEARELFEASQTSDFYTLMRAYEFARKNRFNVDACRRYGVHAQTARQVEQTFEQILQIARQHEFTISSPEAQPSEDPLLRCLMTGFIDQLCVRRDQGTLDCDLTEGRRGTLMRESVVQSAPLFVAASIREVEGRGSENLTLLGLASAIRREWLAETFPERVTTSVEHLYDRTHKRVAAVKLLRLADLVIHHEHQPETEPAAAGLCLADAHLQGCFELPLFDHPIKQLVARANVVAAAMPDLEFPAFDPAALRACFGRAFRGLTLAKEAQAAPLRESFVNHIGRDRLAWLDELAPPTVAWPDGRKLKLLYPESARDRDGQLASPELQVKLPECFGLTEHPRVCEGRLPVRLWLCAPDGKRLESTLNWPAFKTSRYPALRPILRKKYPGVPWL